MSSNNIPRSMFMGFASRFLEGRFSMMPALAMFPTLGLVTAASTMVGYSIVNYQHKKRKVSHIAQ